MSRLADLLNIGGICPRCDKPHAQCVCKALTGPAGDGIVRVGRETKGRRGKGVTTITGLPLDDEGLRALSAQLKNRCGTGGTVKDGCIELQGDHRETVLAELAKLGHKARKSGG